jgi:hypothetical protein
MHPCEAPLTLTVFDAVLSATGPTFPHTTTLIGTLTRHPSAIIILPTLITRKGAQCHCSTMLPTKPYYPAALSHRIRIYFPLYYPYRHPPISSVRSLSLSSSSKTSPSIFSPPAICSRSSLPCHLLSPCVLLSHVALSYISQVVFFKNLVLLPLRNINKPTCSSRQCRLDCILSTFSCHPSFLNNTARTLPSTLPIIPDFSR